MFVRALACFSLLTLLLAADPIALIVDTDAGSDDLMAIAFLLTRPDVRIEAVTISNGLAHVPKGAANVLRLLALAGHSDIPVYLGSVTPLRKAAEFPAEWRRVSDELPGVHLPNAGRAPETMGAADFLVRRLRAGASRVLILALGPLTNLAQAFQRAPAAAQRIDRLMIMGGAFRTPGNLGDGGLYKTQNKRAEWNIFVDSLAARIVFRSGAKIELVPLDATSKVPVNMAFLEEVRKKATSRLGRFVTEVLESDRESIQGGYFQAWDPLAAVALVDPGVAIWTSLDVNVNDEGATGEGSGRKNVRVALDARAEEFKRVFLHAFQ